MQPQFATAQEAFRALGPKHLFAPSPNHFSGISYPKGRAVLKILRVANVLRVVNLLSDCDLALRRAWCGSTASSWELQTFSPQRRKVRGVVNIGGGGSKNTAAQQFTLFFYRRSIFSTGGSFAYARMAQEPSRKRKPELLEPLQPFFRGQKKNINCFNIKGGRLNQGARVVVFPRVDNPRATGILRPPPFMVRQRLGGGVVVFPGSLGGSWYHPNRKRYMRILLF